MDLEEIVIDLSGDKLDESWLAMFGGAVQSILKGMFGSGVPNVKIKGSKSDVKAFSDALKGEKTYMTNFMNHGLNDPQTLKSKGKLKSAVSKFERKTGLKWPFK